MLRTLDEDLSGDVELLNLTRAATYVAGRFSIANLSRTFADARSLWRRAADFDVVDIHTAFVPAVTMLRASLLAAVARARGARSVLHVHGGGLPDWIDRGWKSRLLALALTPVDMVVAVSAGIAASLRPVHGDVVVIPNGVDTQRFAPAEGEHDPPVVLYVGLLTERKGVVDLIEASHWLKARGIDHRLVLVGGRPDEGDEAELVVRNASSGDEDFVGDVDHGDMPQWYRSADVFCLPSWYEAMPLSVLEAMAVGLPTVATSVGEIPNMVDSDVGRLVSPHDREALAAALGELLGDRSLRERLGEQARRRAVERYSVERTLSDTARIYERVLERSRR